MIITLRDFNYESRKFEDEKIYVNKIYINQCKGEADLYLSDGGTQHLNNLSSIHEIEGDYNETFCVLYMEWLIVFEV